MWHFGDQKSFYPLSAIKPRFFGCPAGTLVIVPTELSRQHNLIRAERPVSGEACLSLLWQMTCSHWSLLQCPRCSCSCCFTAC